MTKFDMMERPGAEIRASAPGLTTSTLLEPEHVMAASQHTTSAPAKRCEVCGGPIEGKPSYVAKRRFCSTACRTTYQTGENNPHWRGGNVNLVCPVCKGEFAVYPSQQRKRVYCGKGCADAAQADAPKGEHSPHWKGGVAASQRRYLNKLRGLPAGHVPPQRAKRLCKACGLTGVPKGRVYHPGCSPASLPPKAVEVACADCGATKRHYPKAGGELPKRCTACEYKRRKGEGNANWRGGITPVNKAIRASDEYRAWRTAVFERDRYTCVWCGQVGGKLHADHILPFATYPDLRLVVSNGRTLCVPCHQTTPTYMNKAKKFKADDQ